MRGGLPRESRGPTASVDHRPIRRLTIPSVALAAAPGVTIVPMTPGTSREIEKSPPDQTAYAQRHQSWDKPPGQLL